MDDLPLLYLVTGLFTFAFGPLSGLLSDRFGKYNVFVGGCLVAMGMVGWYTNLGITPLWIVILIHVILFAGLTARMVSASALVSAVPEPADRGAFMVISSSFQQISGGVSSAVAGMIVVNEPSGRLAHYDILGLVVMGTLTATMVLFGVVNRMVMRNQLAAGPKLQAMPANRGASEGAI
jgi:MFS family permease